MTLSLERAKRIVREHPCCRGLYGTLAGKWTNWQIYFYERMFGRYHTAERFDRIFRKTPDPWNYRGDPASEQRRELILKMLPRKHYPRLLEVGCASGWMTLPLARRTGELVAADISSIALARAREECRGAPNVHFLKLDLLSDPVVGTFEGIVCAGVLVYLPDTEQRQIRDRLVASLVAGGDLILEHTTGTYPGEVSGSRIHALYQSHRKLKILRHEIIAEYAITVFRRAAA